MIAERGLRVVRGEAWSHSDQDGGEGSLGTVVHVRNDVYKSTVSVVWDCGLKGCYDVDNATPGVVVAHDAKQSGEMHRCVCSECKDVIVGIVWNCLMCTPVCLCFTCYMDDKHSLQHPFRRKAGCQGNWVNLPERKNSAKVVSKGLFPGATVERTSTLRQTVLRSTFQSLDDNFGRIINYESCVGNSFSAVCVVWNQSLKKAVYQLGRDGKVELRCTVAGYGPAFYRTHLPELVKSSGMPVRTRGYTTSQIPLHCGLQYSSLQASPSCYVKTEDAALQGARVQGPAQAMAGRMTGNHRYTKSSTVDTKSFKAAGEISRDAIEEFANIMASQDEVMNTIQDAWRTPSKQLCAGDDRSGNQSSYSPADSVTNVEGSDDAEQGNKKRCFNAPCEEREFETSGSSTRHYGFAIGDSLAPEIPNNALCNTSRFSSDQVSQQFDIQKACRSTHQDEARQGGSMQGKADVPKLTSALGTTGKSEMFGGRNRLCFNDTNRRGCASSTGACSLSGNSDDSGPQRHDVIRCCLCRENESDIIFEPCGHLLSCSGCAKYFKRCFLCKGVILSTERRNTTASCIVCHQSEACVLFKPCMHTVSCAACCIDLKYCVQCKRRITEKMDTVGNRIESPQSQLLSFESLLSSVEKLRSKVMALEGRSKCLLCTVNDKNVLFQCGHATCESCGERLIVCPICHVKIEVKTLHSF